MRVAHVHAAVEVPLGETVSANSVSWVLASHSTGPSAQFVRVARPIRAGRGGAAADERVLHDRARLRDRVGL